MGQAAKLPVEALAAGVVFARVAPAVAAPVAERFDQRLEQRRVGEDRAAFAHGDVVGGIEADGGEVAERAHLPAVDRSRPARRSSLRSARGRAAWRSPSRPRGRTDCPACGRASWRVFFPTARLPAGSRRRCRSGVNVDEHRHQAVLQDRVDRGGKAGGDGDHLVARLRAGGPPAWARSARRAPAGWRRSRSSPARRCARRNSARSRARTVARSGPVVSQKSSEESTRDCISAASKTRPATGTGRLAGDERAAGRIGFSW